MAPDILKKNQAILWARDILGREAECVIVCCDTNKNALADKAGNVALLSLTGARKQVKFSDFSDADAAAALKEALKGREVIAAALDPDLEKALVAEFGVTQIIDLMERYRQFIAMEVNIAPTSAAQNLATWVFDALRTMASSSLVLDQANTGEEKWTSSHFKVTGSMMDKLRSFIKS